MATADLDSWIREVAAHTRPEHVQVILGTEEEAAQMRDLLIAAGKLIELNHASFPRCYLYRSDKNDVARTEHCTFICTKTPEDAGPTNNWKDPAEAKGILLPMFKDVYAGKTLYVIPYTLGPGASKRSKVGVQVTDSPYVVLSYIGKMYRVGKTALDRIARGESFVRSLHAVGTLDPAQRHICHFPDEKLVISINSEYGGNAILAKKSDGLRMRSFEAVEEGWHAEHMATFRITFEDGETITFGYMGPSGCGKTNSATQDFKDPKYVIETVCEDISYLNVEDDGRLHVIAPESGMFAILAGINPGVSPALYAMLTHDTVFTNAAYDPASNEPWWEGCGRPAPEGLIAWDGTPWSPEQGRPAAHKNSRITVHASNCPTAKGSYDDPAGIPLDVILMATRSSEELPLIYEPYGWEHGIYCGMTMVSETTDAVGGPVGVPRFDSFAMKPFCGPNMGDYAGNWLRTGRLLGDRVPMILGVNLYRKKNGKFTWPGFEQNKRLYEYARKRLHRARGLSVVGGEAVATPLGFVPAPGALNLDGLNFSTEQERALHELNPKHLQAMIKRNAEFFTTFGKRMPVALWRQHAAFEQRVLTGA